MSKQGNVLLATIVGGLIGVVGGLLYAPKSGKETREDINKLAVKISSKLRSETVLTKKRVRDIFGKVTKEATGKYSEIKSTVAAKVAAVKTAGENVDKEKYEKLVEGVVGDFKSDIQTIKGNTAKMVGYLKKDWEKVKKAIS